MPPSGFIIYSSGDLLDHFQDSIVLPLRIISYIYGRYDCYRDAKTWSSLRTDYGISGNYHLGKNLIFQLNYTFTDARTARRAATRTDSRYNTFDVQVTAKF